jgi:hypothetical protein
MNTPIMSSFRSIQKAVPAVPPQLYSPLDPMGARFADPEIDGNGEAEDVTDAPVDVVDAGKIAQKVRAHQGHRFRAEDPRAIEGATVQ